MTDVACHSWILPTLLRHAGVDFLHIGCNAACRSPRVPTLFWWQGPDGSRLLTMYSAAGYGTSLAPPEDWPYQTWLALIHTGDNHGPPRPEEVAKVLADAKQTLPGVKVRIGRLSDFADAIRAEAPAIPVVRGDMPDTWIHGPMCDPAGARVARNLRPLLGVAEGLETELAAWGVGLPGAAAGPALAAAREQSLLYGEHTWGGALSWVVKYSQHTEYWYGEAWKEQRAAGRFKKLEGLVGGTLGLHREGARPRPAGSGPGIELAGPVGQRAGRARGGLQPVTLEAGRAGEPGRSWAARRCEGGRREGTRPGLDPRRRPLFRRARPAPVRLSHIPICPGLRS